MSRTRILIVDDNKNIRTTLRMALETEEAWSPETASDGEEGLALLQTGKFGLALVDLKMPGMDGLEVLRRIRATQPGLPILIITAFGTVESSVTAMKLGAVDFLQKPFTPEQIRNRVREVLAAPRKEPDPFAPVLPAARSFEDLVAAGKRQLRGGAWNEARESLQLAIALRPDDPEVLNLLGAASEIRGDGAQAQKFYRAALSFLPAYGPARQNLERLTLRAGAGDILLDDERRMTHSR